VVGRLVGGMPVVDKLVLADGKGPAGGTVVARSWRRCMMAGRMGLRPRKPHQQLQLLQR